MKAADAFRISRTTPRSICPIASTTRRTRVASPPQPTGSAMRPRSITPTSRARRAEGAHPRGGNRLHRARPRGQPSLDRRHDVPRLSRRRRSHPQRRRPVRSRRNLPVRLDRQFEVLYDATLGDETRRQFPASRESASARSHGRALRRSHPPRSVATAPKQRCANARSIMTAAPAIKGWCPTLLSPMESGDGWLAR